MLRTLLVVIAPILANGQHTDCSSFYGNYYYQNSDADSSSTLINYQSDDDAKYKITVGPNVELVDFILYLSSVTYDDHPIYPGRLHSNNEDEWLVCDVGDAESSLRKRVITKRQGMVVWHIPSRNYCKTRITLHYVLDGTPYYSSFESEFLNFDVDTGIPDVVVDANSCLQYFLSTATVNNPDFEIGCAGSPGLIIVPSALILTEMELNVNYNFVASVKNSASLLDFTREINRVLSEIFVMNSNTVPRIAQVRVPDTANDPYLQDYSESLSADRTKAFVRVLVDYIEEGNTDYDLKYSAVYSAFDEVLRNGVDIYGESQTAFSFTFGGNNVTTQDFFHSVRVLYGGLAGEYSPCQYYKFFNIPVQYNSMSRSCEPIDGRTDCSSVGVCAGDNQECVDMATDHYYGCKCPLLSFLNTQTMDCEEASQYDNSTTAVPTANEQGQEIEESTSLPWWAVVLIVITALAFVAIVIAALWYSKQ